ncbi:BTH_I0359 family protein [Methylibium sp.]|uniref:BTH_I0359 family protein n=1 Tax=Methylibium sp. TaxID=2067992 RepID=UPI003D0E32E5
MQMLYNSDSFAVVQFEVASAGPDLRDGVPGLTRGGYEIVDKFARKEIFIEGALAASFREGVDALIETSPSEEEIDAYVARYAALMQQPLVLH